MKKFLKTLNIIYIFDPNSEDKIKQFNLEFSNLFKSIKTCSSDDEALLIYKENPDKISTIISGISNEDSSIKFLKEIRKINTHIPFIAINDSNRPSFLHDFIKNDGDYILSSNFTRNELLEAVTLSTQKYLEHKNTKLLREENQDYIDTLNDYVIVSKTDLKGRITFANDIFCTISGYSREELIGKHHNILRHPETPKQTFEDMWNTIKSGNQWKGVVKNKTKNDEVYITNATINPIYKDNIIVGYIGTRNLITNEINEKRKLKSNITNFLRKHRKEIKEYKDKIIVLNADLKKFKDSINLQESLTKEKESSKLHSNSVDKLQKELNNTDKKYKELIKNHTTLTSKLENLKKAFKTDKGKLVEKNSELTSEIESLKEELQKKVEDIISCQKRNEDLKDIIESYSINIGSKLT